MVSQHQQDKARRDSEKHRKWRWFAAEYMLDGNAAGAARRCGMANPQNAGQVLVRENKFVQDLIARGYEDRKKEIEVEVSEIIMELRRIAFSDISGYASWNTQDNKLKIMKSGDIEPSARRAIKKIKQSADGGVEIELHDKMAALDKLAKHMGMFIDIKDYTVRFQTDVTLLSTDELHRLIEIERKRLPIPGSANGAGQPATGSNGV